MVRSTKGCFIFFLPSEFRHAVLGLIKRLDEGIKYRRDRVHNAIVNNEPLSLAKAKRDGIKMAKLPLDRYLEWAPGSKKNLNINHMVPILLDLKLTADWEYSLRHIPRRKLMETTILAMQKKLKHNPKLQNVVMKNFNISKLNKLAFKEKKLDTLPFKEKKFISKRSLYDDENI